METRWKTFGDRDIFTHPYSLGILIEWKLYLSGDFLLPLPPSSLLARDIN